MRGHILRSRKHSRSLTLSVALKLPGAAVWTGLLYSIYLLDLGGGFTYTGLRDLDCYLEHQMKFVYLGKIFKGKMHLDFTIKLLN